MTTTATTRFLNDYFSAFDTIEGMFSPDAALMFIAYNRLIADEGISGDVLEIGVHHGLSTIAIAAMRGQGGKLLAVDLFEGMQALNVSASGSGNEERFIANMSHFFPNTSFIQTYAGLSSNLTPSQTGCGYAFCHIDGGHSANETRGDLELCCEISRAGGLIALDDYFNPSFPGVCEGAVRFMLENPGALTPVAIGFNKVLFQRTPSPFDLNAMFARAYPQVQHSTAHMWDTDVFLFGGGFRTFFDVEASTPSMLVSNDAFRLRAEIAPLEDELLGRAGETVYLPVRLRNDSTVTFRADGCPFGLSYHLLNHDGQSLQFDNRRQYFYEPVEPGETVTVGLPVLAPDKPGAYVMELDVVWEGIAWLKDKGSETSYARLTVTP